MKQRELSLALKGIVLLGLLCCLLLGGVIAPSVGSDVRAEYPMLSHMYWPCLAYIWATAVPVLVALWLVWRMAVEIGRDNSFCHANARRLKLICRLALADTAAYVAAAVTLGVMHLLHISILLVVLGVAACGVAIAVVAAVGSHLVYKAAVLKDENDLTI